MIPLELGSPFFFQDGHDLDEIQDVTFQCLLDARIPSHQFVGLLMPLQEVVLDVEESTIQWTTFVEAVHEFLNDFKAATISACNDG